MELKSEFEHTKMVQIAEKYAPVIWLHSLEDYYPIEIEEYLQRTTLWKDKKLVSLNPSFEELSCLGPEYTLKMDINLIHGAPKDEVNQVPIYTYIDDSNEL